MLTQGSCKLLICLCANRCPLWLHAWCFLPFLPVCRNFNPARPVATSPVPLFQKASKSWARCKSSCSVETMSSYWCRSENITTRDSGPGMQHSSGWVQPATGGQPHCQVCLQREIFPAPGPGNLLSAGLTRALPPVPTRRALPFQSPFHTACTWLDSVMGVRLCNTA